MRRTLTAIALALVVAGGGGRAAYGYHSGAQHWGSFVWGGTQMSPVRFVYVIDRASDPNTSAGLRQYIGSMQNMWKHYPALPYLVYVDQRSFAGGCHTSAGHFSGHSMILVCSGNPAGGGAAAYSWWRWDGRNHFVGEASIWVSPGFSAGHNYTIACHEVGHVIGFTAGGHNGAGHSNNPRSCLHWQIQGPNIGYDSNDLAELVALYHSHFPG